MRRHAAKAALAFALGAPGASPSAEPPIVPIPASVKARSGTLAVTSATALAVEPGDVGAQRAAANFADLVARTHGVRLRVRHDRPAGAIAFRRVRNGPPEGYRIEVDAKGARLSASTEAGFSHATATLWQILAKGRKGATLPAIEIEDAPRFAWRGVMLDSARHFQSPEFVRRFIDWMALHKLNVLHWHLTDDQAWRLEILKYPRLAQVGGWRVPAGAAAAQDLDPATGRPRMYGGYYSQATVRALVSYAAERGITIVPEIEMPGHATAAIVAYPQLAAGSQPPTAVPADWGIYPNALNLDESTFAFLEDVLREVIALFPSAYIHVGGDEVDTAQWRDSQRVRARMRELGIDDVSRVQAHFTQRMARFLHANGRRLVGWDEILEQAAPAGAVVMSWRGTGGALVAVTRGHDTVVASHPTLHFDNAQAISAREPPGRARVVSLRDVYAFEPVLASIAPEQRHHVLGVQGNVWTEHVRTEARVAWMTYPRAAAVAEIGWSQPERRGFEGFYRRMQALEARYAGLDLRARPLADPALRRPGPLGPFRSHDLKLCTEHIALAVEDDAPLAGARPSFLVDVRNPCWILPAARLDRVDGIAISVGQVPYNFQIGEEVQKVRFPAPTTPEGELEVRLGCEGELVARLPLAPAAISHEVTALPPAPLAPRRGRHDLCLRFAQPRLDPLWVIDTLRLLEGAP